jgi:hypothetical protein
MPRRYQFVGVWQRFRFLLCFLNLPHKVVKGWGEGFAAEGATATKTEALSMALLSPALGCKFPGGAGF